MKNIIVGLLTVVIFGLMAFTAMGGRAYQGGQHGKIIQNIGQTKVKQAITTQEKDDRKKEQDQINTLKEKAGSAGAFKVSHKYKSKCSSCHGVNGSGFQNGKPMMGPKLIGQNAETVFKKLLDFKAGRKENLVMKGLLIKLNKEELKELADEIGEFQARQKALQNK